MQTYRTPAGTLVTILGTGMIRVTGPDPGICTHAVLTFDQTPPTLMWRCNLCNVAMAVGLECVDE